jgi:glycosyltransferase involved in cell wall biosynthesis
MRGGEKVVEALCEMFPEADIFTHVYHPPAISSTIKRHRIQTTFVQKLPRSVYHYRKYLPLMPLALEQLDLCGYDLVVSSESGPAKGILVPPCTPHLCYCHTPMRYVWDMYHDYAVGAGRLVRLMMPLLAHYLRIWDVTSAARVDHFVANSRHVAMRIARYYRRSAQVIPPPVDTSAFAPVVGEGDYYLVVGELVRYKRADLAVEAFNRLGKPLIVIGDGEQLTELRAKAGDNIKIMGYQPFEVVRDHYARCKALIFPGEEDFGIVPVECMASGRPVIALRRGGVLDTIVEGVTGFFFEEQDVDSLIDAVIRFESNEANISSEVLVEHASKYDRELFKKRIGAAIEELMRNFALLH